MAKKRVSVYTQEGDIEWLTKYPVAGSMSGSAVLIMEWAMRQIRRGAITAHKKFDANELEAIISYAVLSTVTPDFSPSMLAMALRDWFLYDEGAGLKWGEEMIETLIGKCEELSHSEVMGLLAWAYGFWTSGSADMGLYIKSAPK